jgi:hypothetical protein
LAAWALLLLLLAKHVISGTWHSIETPFTQASETPSQLHCLPACMYIFIFNKKPRGALIYNSSSKDEVGLSGRETLQRWRAG